MSSRVLVIPVVAAFALIAAACGGSPVSKAEAPAAAPAVDQEGDARRRLIIRLHAHDRSWIAGIRYDEVVWRERADHTTLLVADNSSHRDEIDARFKCGLWRLQLS